MYGMINSLNHLVVPLNYTDVSFMFIGSRHMATYVQNVLEGKLCSGQKCKWNWGYNVYIVTDGKQFQLVRVTDPCLRSSNICGKF